MAIINSYPNITPTSEDLLLISDTSVDGNPTKTATINDVLALLPSGGGGGGISTITSSNTNFLSVTNTTGPLVTLNIQTGFVASGGNTLATTGDIYNFTTTSITNAIDNLGALTSFACDISNIPAFSQSVTTTSAGATTLTISRTGGSANQFLDYTGNWSTPSVQGMTFWAIDGDVGSAIEVKDKSTVDFEGGTKITTDIREINTGEYRLTIFHDAQSQTNTTPSTTLTNGGTFTALSENVSLDNLGHVTGQVLRTYTLPTNAINSIGFDAPIQNIGTASDPIIDIEEADGTTDGYLSATKFAEFDAKQTEVSLSVNGTSGAATFDAATGALNIPVYSGGGGGGVSGVGLDVSAFNALSVTMQGGGPNPITGSDTFELGIAGGPVTTEYLDGSGNWSTPAGTATNLSNVPQQTSVLLQSSSGTNTSIPEVNVSNDTAGVMTPAQKTRLNSLQVTSNGTALGISPINTSTNTLTMPWGGTSSQVVLGDGSLSTLPAQFSWTLDGDSGSQPIADQSVVNIVGAVGGSISTSVIGNTLTISSTASGSGTVTDIDTTPGIFTVGSVSTSPNPITTSGTISFDLSAVGPTDGDSADPDRFCFLRGDNKWAQLAMGPGIFITSLSQAPFQTSIKVNYNGNQNVVKSANPVPVAGVDLSDTIIMNDATNSSVYETTLQSIKDAIVTSRAPTAFSVDKSGNIQNSGNYADDTQGFGTISTTLESSGYGFVISFAQTQSNTNYMINFTIEQPTTSSGGTDYAISAWVPSSAKTTSGFTILYDKGGSGTGLGPPELTNFQLYR